ncbi:MAG TPA: lysophospholipid acyltransferase family protein, partial [Acidimicrobiales bacterium]|nr:lysophospholipid acyltransferase family protein [Acidimicrobiales bacterium]
MTSKPVTDSTYRFLRFLAHGINRLYFRVEVDGKSKVPASGPVILAPVHRSFMDFFAVSEATPRKVFYMAKDDLWSKPRFGNFLESLGAFPVHREGADRQALDRSREVLEHGEVLILFPEGTRRTGSRVSDLHEGAAFLAARTGAALVPIGIGGTDKAMPKGSHLIRPVKVYLEVGDPLYPPPPSDRGRVPRSQVHELTIQLEADLQKLYDIARAKAARSSGEGSSAANFAPSRADSDAT